MRAIVAGLIFISCVFGCAAQEIDETPLREYLEEAHRVTVQEVSPEREHVLDLDDDEDGDEGEEEEKPFFEPFLGETRYDVVKDVILSIKGGEVAYRFRRVASDKAYPPHEEYYEFEFHVEAEGPGRLFLDEARFVAHAVYDGTEFHPKVFRVGLRDGSFRHLMTYRVHPDGEGMTVVDEISGVKTEHEFRHDDVVDPVTFFFNLFCKGVDLRRVTSLHGHLLHPDESPIIVRIDQEERSAEAGFGPGEFLPRKRCKFRFFFDETGKIDVSRFELEYGIWSMRMEATSGPAFE